MNPNFDQLKTYESYLLLGNFSPRTSRSYVTTVRYFLQFCEKEFPLNPLSQELAREYLMQRYQSGLSWSAINCDYSALRKYFKNIIDVEWSFKKIPRPRKDKVLPRILSQDEIIKIIESAVTYKQQIFFTFLYSTGMRLSEAIHIKIEDIDAKRLQIRINLGNGHKDRFVQVPECLIKILREYYQRMRPQIYLFNGIKKGNPYSSRAVQWAMKRSKSIGKITKKGSVHTFRHCYATHHLENGTDLVYIQEQLGHKNLKTTAKYIHLCVDRYRNIKHPIDQVQIRFR